METKPVPQLNTIQASILDAVGNTPIVRLPKGFDKDVKCEILMKLEFMNPSGSIKDRIALHMVKQAEHKGLLKEGGRIVECSSGNTGAGLAMVAAALGYDITVVIPDKMSSEKIAAIKGWGADVVVTPANVSIEHPMHYTKVAKHIAENTKGAWWPDQYHNPDNTEAHYLYTAKEIVEQCNGQIDYFIAGAGTGGSLSGIGRYLKEQIPDCKVIGVDPEGSVLAHYWKTKEVIEGASYAVEGVGEEEIPKAWDPSIIDDYVIQNDKDSFLTARKLAEETGILSGGSSGFNLAATLSYAKTLPQDARVVTLLPDYGKAYLSKIYNEDYMKDKYLQTIPASIATARDLCRDKNTAQLTQEDTVAWGIRQAGERQIRPLPVLKNEKLIGVFDEDRALQLLKEGADLDHITVTECISEAPTVIDGDEPWHSTVDIVREEENVFINDKGTLFSLNTNDLLQSLSRLDHTK